MIISKGVIRFNYSHLKFNVKSFFEVFYEFNNFNPFSIINPPVSSQIIIGSKITKSCFYIQVTKWQKSEDIHCFFKRSSFQAESGSLAKKTC